MIPVEIETRSDVVVVRTLPTRRFLAFARSLDARWTGDAWEFRREHEPAIREHVKMGMNMGSPARPMPVPIPVPVAVAPPPAPEPAAIHQPEPESAPEKTPIGALAIESIVAPPLLDLTLDLVTVLEPGSALDAQLRSLGRIASALDPAAADPAMVEEVAAAFESVAERLRRSLRSAHAVNA